MQLYLAASFHHEIFLFIFVYLSGFRSRDFLQYFANNDVCPDFEVAREGVLDDHWSLEIDIEAARMLRLLLPDDRELISMIQVCLNKNEIIYLISYCGILLNLFCNCTHSDQTRPVISVTIITQLTFQIELRHINGVSITWLKIHCFDNEFLVGIHESNFIHHISQVVENEARSNYQDLSHILDLNSINHEVHRLLFKELMNVEVGIPQVNIYKKC